MSSPVRRLLKFLAILPIVAYLSVVGMMLLMETELLFHPPERDADQLAAAAAAAGAREVRLMAEDGVSLYGWRLRNKSERAVLYFSGNGDSVGDNTLLYQRLHRAGLNVLHVNYRGYPGSEGSPDEEGLRKDARAAWRLLMEDFKPHQVTVLGYSLGGGVATGLAAEVSPRALVLMSTFTAAADVAQDTYPFVPARLLMQNPFDSAALAPKVKAPVLILHGTKDTFIRPHHAEGLAAAFDERPDVLWIQGAGHNDDLLGEPRALEALLALTQPVEKIRR